MDNPCISTIESKKKTEKVVIEEIARSISEKVKISSNGTPNDNCKVVKESIVKMPTIIAERIKKNKENAALLAKEREIDGAVKETMTKIVDTIIDNEDEAAFKMPVLKRARFLRIDKTRYESISNQLLSLLQLMKSTGSPIERVTLAGLATHYFSDAAMEAKFLSSPEEFSPFLAEK